MRTTKKEILEWLETANRLIAESGYRLILGERYGYKAIDLGYTDRGSICRTLKTGMTAGECIDYISAFLTGIEIYTYRRE